jgi:hypothetical protein
MESVNTLLTQISAIIALLAFIKGIVEFVHQNSIRRHEKFHQMSVRFDESESIQKVCRLLHDPSSSSEKITQQEKEVFICFMEEIYFMKKSGIMNRNLALYAFGYYAKMASDSKKFWEGLNKEEPYYLHFIEFCSQARAYKPKVNMSRKKNFSIRQLYNKEECLF